jgi:hypothetical protein
MDRNAVARLLFAAEAYDRGTHQPGAHGGALKRTGLAVLRAIANRFHNRVTGRCDPSLAAIARAAGVARSTAALALGRLRSAGFLDWTRRGVTVSRRICGAEAGLLFAQVSNAYRLSEVPPQVPGPVQTALKGPRNSESECRTETRFLSKISTSEPGTGEAARDSCGLEAALARLGSAIRAREALGRSMAAQEGC